MERATHHDPEALLAHADWLRALATRLVREGRDDLVQDTWLAALRAAGSRRGSVRSWLGAIARNTARQRVRGDANRTNVERARAGEGAPSDEELRERLELQRWLADHVDALPAPQRRVLLLRYYEGLPPRQIARLLGEPLATVKTRLKRALGELRERVERDGRRDDGSSREWGLPALAPLVDRIPKGSWLGIARLGMGGFVMGSKGIAVTLAVAVLVALAAFAGLRAGGTAEEPGLTGAASVTDELASAPEPGEAPVEGVAASAPNEGARELATVEERADAGHHARCRRPRERCAGGRRRGSRRSLRVALRPAVAQDDELVRPRAVPRRTRRRARHRRPGPRPTPRGGRTQLGARPCG